MPIVADPSIGETLFDCADRLRLPLASSCSRQGTCHECIVEIQSGLSALTPRTGSEAFLKENLRLACQCSIADLTEPVEFRAFQRKPKILTSYDAQHAAPQTIASHHYGVAIDLGTTTVVLELIDLASSLTVYTASFENPQRFGGSDVMNRISYDSGPYRGELHKAIIQAVNHFLTDAYAQLHLTRDQVTEMVVSGNATMRELFFKLDVQSIGQRPYKSTIEHEYREGKRTTTALSQPAHKLGLLTHPKANIYGPPLVASHVGADTTAALAAIDFTTIREPFLLVDIGTNTEVVVGHNGKYVAASCPAGPAFEGGLVQYGMPGVDGAIEAIRYSNGAWQYDTIGGIPPEGICGSGLIDLLAELRRYDLMTPKGVFANKVYTMPIVPEHGITFSRQDGSHLAQAKAANFCGQFIALRHLGVLPSQISRLYLAGGFANYIDVANAIDIGFLAPVPVERITKIGNASLAGSRLLLLNPGLREAIQTQVAMIEHIELETTPDFFDIFVEGCQFKPMPA